jgi:hypothetical protein
MALEGPVLRKKSTNREFSPQGRVKHKVAPPTIPLGMLPAPWERPIPCFASSLLVDLTQDGPIPIVAKTFERGPQSGKYFPSQTTGSLLERETKPRRASKATRLSLVLLSRLFAWPDTLIIVTPETFLGWHRLGFRLLWRWKSRPRGRPRLPQRLQELILKMAYVNPTWGEERIAETPPPPWRRVPPPLPVYRERGHRRLAVRTYEEKCATCI